MIHHRDIVFINKRMPVALQCLPHFKLHNCPVDFPRPQAIHAHHPYFLEYSFPERTGIKAIREYSYKLSDQPQFNDFSLSPIQDSLVASHDAKEKLEEVESLINALSPYHIFSYGAHQSWFIDMNADSMPRMRYGQEGYTHPFKNTIDGIQPISNYADPVAFTITEASSDLQKLVQTEDLFFAYFNSTDQPLKEKYLNACKVLSKSQILARYDMNAGFVFMINSLEALISIIYENAPVERCETCGRERYRVSRKFKDFLDEFCFNIPNKKKDRLYSLRSSIVHNGQLLNTSHKMFLENQDDLDSEHKSTIDKFEYWDLNEISKTCFKVFLYEKF